MQSLDKYEINVMLKSDVGKTEEEVLGFSPLPPITVDSDNDNKKEEEKLEVVGEHFEILPVPPLPPFNVVDNNNVNNKEEENRIEVVGENFEILPVPRHVFAFWFGNPMKGARLAAYTSFVKNIGVPVILIGDNNLKEYNVPEHPMHKVVDLEFGKGLSMNHLVDYLRVYFMHFHGGGYHDIKQHRISWAPHFDIMENSTIWAYGIPDAYGGIGCDESYMLNNRRCSAKESELYGRENLKGLQGGCCQKVKDSWANLISNGAYICRPKTPLTCRWLTLVESHLDLKYDKLVANPAPTARCCNPKTEPDYPFRWAEIHGEAFHPMQYEFVGHIKGGLPRWRTGSYHDPSEGR